MDAQEWGTSVSRSGENRVSVVKGPCSDLCAALLGRVLRPRPRSVGLGADLRNVSVATEPSVEVRHSERHRGPGVGCPMTASSGLGSLSGSLLDFRALIVGSDALAPQPTYAVNIPDELTQAPRRQRPDVRTVKAAAVQSREDCRTRHGGRRSTDGPTRSARLRTCCPMPRSAFRLTQEPWLDAKGVSLTRFRRFAQGAQVSPTATSAGATTHRRDARRATGTSSSIHAHTHPDCL
jgi:hypothetical protein